MPRRCRTVLVALLLIGVQTAFATPSRAIAGLRAVSCCAMKCRHAGTLRDAMRCCQGTVAPEEVAASVEKQVHPAPVEYLVLPVATPPRLGLVSVGSVVHGRHLARAAPIFLTVRSLRL